MGRRWFSSIWQRERFGDGTGDDTSGLDAEFLLAVYDTGSGELLVEMSTVFEITHLAISDDGRLLAAADALSIYLYDLKLLRSGDSEAALIGSTPTSSFSIDFTDDSSIVLTGSPGAITGQTADASFRELFSIGLGDQLPSQILVRDGYVWTALTERVAVDAETASGLVGLPLASDDLIAFAKSKLSRGFTDAECQQYLGLDSCADR